MKKLTYQLITLTALFLVTIVACKKPEYDADFELPRQFKPGDIGITAGETQAVLGWSPSLFTAGKNVSYTVQISQDSSFNGTVLYTVVTDTSSVTITDSVLQVMQFYFARVKANANGPTAESGWVHSGRFRITGEQIFSPVIDADLKDTSVVLKWRTSPGLTKIVLTPAGGTPVDVALTAGDVTAQQKKINGLIPLTVYTAEIYRNNIKKGTISFTTKERNIFSVVLNPGDDLITAVANAANGDIIGLEPGTYNTISAATGLYANVIVQQKTITIQAKSGNASNTKVNFKEMTIKGTGAGLILKGIEFNGQAGVADYFINFVGLNSDAEAATFTKLIVDNSIVRFTNNAVIRGNRGGNNAHKIDTIQFKNSIVSDNGSSAGFDYILLDKMEFKVLDLSNSTFYNSGRRLISWATNFTAPKPKILIDKVTINSIGYGARDNVLLDANANPVDFTLKNSILANTPKPGQTVGNSLLRATGAGSTVTIANSNLFNLSNGAATPAALVVPAYVVQQNNLAVDLGWTGTTTTFALPAVPSPVRTASETGGPIGDPRWW